MKIAWLALVFSVACIAWLHAEEPAGLDAKLLDTLRSDDFDARQNARNKLIERGEPIRALVTAELDKKSIDPDYKAHLNAVLSGLRELDTLKPFDAPRRITLDEKDATVAALLAKIAAHFEQSVTALDDAGSRRISVALKGATFIESVDAVRRAAGLEFCPRYVARSGKTAAENYVSLALGKRAEGAPDASAASGPFALTLAYTFQPESTAGAGPGLAVRTPYMYAGGTLHFDKAARFSRLKIVSLTAVDADKKDYAIAPPNNAVSAVRFYKFWSGNTAQSGSFTCVFDGTFRFAEAIPTKLLWKLKLAAEVPVKTAEERITMLETKIDAQQDLEQGSVTITASNNAYDGWTLTCTIGGDAYIGQQPPRAQFSAMPEGPPGTPGSAGLGYPALKFLDDKGVEIAYQIATRNYTSDPPGLRKVQFAFRLASKPVSMVFTRTLKTAVREYEFEIPAVPVPFGERGQAQIRAELIRR